MDTPKILVIDNSKDITGAFQAIYRFMKYSESYFNFSLVLPKNSRAQELVTKQINHIYKIPFLELRKSIFNIAFYVPYLLFNSIRILRIVKKNKIDLIHINDFYNLTGAIVKLLGGRVKLITHIRFLPNRFPKLLVRVWLYFAFKYSDKIICVSEAVRQQLPKHEKIVLIYDSILFDKKSIPRKQTEGIVRFVYPSNYIPGKGQDYALEAFARAYEEDKKIKLKFLGGGIELIKNKRFKESLMNRISALELDDVVELGGTYLELKSVYENNDVALMFSESESFSLVCLETLSIGIPLIATDCGGPAEIIESDKSGKIVLNKNVEDMKRAMLHLAANHITREIFALNGQVFVKDKFSTKNTWDKLIKLYQDTI